MHRGLRYPAEQRYGEESPPESDAQEGEPRSLTSVTEPEHCGSQNHRDVHGEQEPAPEVAEGVPCGGDTVDFISSRDVWKKGVVERQTRGESDIARSEQHCRQEPVASID